MRLCEKTKEIIAEIERRTARESYRISLETKRKRKPFITDSKIGGLPYWPISMEYPTNSKGQKLVLLAQINFDKENVETPLPKKGLLQFFISNDEDDLMMGLDLEHPDVQDGFRVVYHDEIDDSVTAEQVEELGIKRAEEYSAVPVERECLIKLVKKTCYITPDFPDDFDAIVNAILFDIFHEDKGELDAYDYFGDELDEIRRVLGENGLNNVLGYPYFTQSDPRNDNYYDTVLLQLDSISDEDEDILLWGDVGIGNFFINWEDLKRRDFSKVLYNWDCP